MSKTDELTGSTITSRNRERIIGKLEGEQPGPVILVFSGLHGNEPAGVEALNQVFEMLDPSYFRGKFIGLKANIAALREQVRFIDEDMNRIWFPSIIEKVRHCQPGDLKSIERVQIKELLAIIDHELPAEGDHPTIFVDLHSFSAQGCMFALTACNERNIQLLEGLHIPMIFGVEQALQGTALRYFQDKDYITFALEGGNHRSDLTIYNNTAALLMLMQYAGNLDREQIPEFEEYERHLDRHSRYLPKKLEFVYQHFIEPGDNFSMRPGYQNFESVKEGEWLANDKNGKIRAQCDGYIIMPLYQKQGDDGFFIVQKQHN